MCVCVFQEPDQLFEVLAQCLLASVDRDAMSGWGGVVHIMYALWRGVVVEGLCCTVQCCRAVLGGELVDSPFRLLAFHSTPKAIITRTLKGRQD